MNPVMLHVHVCLHVHMCLHVHVTVSVHVPVHACHAYVHVHIVRICVMFVFTARREKIILWQRTHICTVPDRTMLSASIHSVFMNVVGRIGDD